MKIMPLVHRSGVVALALGTILASSAQGGPPETLVKLVVPDGAADDRLGCAVGMSGDVAIVGADRADDMGSNSGSAYMFRWSGGVWIAEQKLVPEDGAAESFFGFSVAVSGDVAAVGVPYDGDNGILAGSAYLYRWIGGAWIEEQKVRPAVLATYDLFGFSIAASGDVAIVGAPYDEASGVDAGAAYAFRWDGSAWNLEQKLVASDGAAGDLLGITVGVSGNIAVVGAPYDADNGTNAGAAYVFRWNGTAWVEEQKLLADDGCPGDQFGASVGVSGDVAVVSAWLDDEGGTNAGAAYVFRWSGTAWVQEQKIKAADPAADDLFGQAVAVDGNMVVVGAHYNDDLGPNSGSAYTYRWNGNDWVPEQKVVPADGAAFDHFGWAVGVSGERAVIGAWRADDSGPESGSASVVTFGSGPVGDLDGDGAVNGSDLGILLAAWGTPGPGDLSGDGTVDGADLGTLLAAWTG